MGKASGFYILFARIRQMKRPMRPSLGWFAWLGSDDFRGGGFATSIVLGITRHRALYGITRISMRDEPHGAELKDKETGSLAREVASLTGETLTEAIPVSLSERLRRERLKRGRPANFADELQAIARRGDALPVLDGETADEIIGYDESGLPF